MTTAPDKLHYFRMPNNFGGRAEMVRMTYVLAGKPWVDEIHATGGAFTTTAGKNPYKQLPFIETAAGEFISQTIAIMHHVGHGTSAWPGDPSQLTRALIVCMGGYDLYQAFAGFNATDTVAKQKFEGRRAPQYFTALGVLYEGGGFAAGAVPCFADCVAHQAIAWCLRRNEVCRALYEANPSLQSFMTRFEAVPAIHEFMARQVAARAVDDGV